MKNIRLAWVTSEFHGSNWFSTKLVMRSSFSPIPTTMATSEVMPVKMEGWRCLEKVEMNVNQQRAILVSSISPSE